MVCVPHHGRAYQHCWSGPTGVQFHLTRVKQSMDPYVGTIWVARNEALLVRYIAVEDSERSPLVIKKKEENISNNFTISSSQLRGFISGRASNPPIHPPIVAWTHYKISVFKYYCFGACWCNYRFRGHIFVPFGIFHSHSVKLHGFTGSVRLKHKFEFSFKLFWGVRVIRVMRVRPSAELCVASQQVQQLENVLCT